MALVSACLVLSGGFPAQAVGADDLVVNGDFNGMRATTDIPGWVVEHGCFGYVNEPGGPPGGGATWIGLGTIYQDLVTIAGQKYLLSFYAAGDDPGQSPRVSSMRVWWGSELVGTFTFVNTPVFGQPRWKNFSFEVFAMSRETRLRFETLTGIRGYSGLDQVRVIANPAPPPRDRPPASSPFKIRVGSAGGGTGSEVVLPIRTDEFTRLTSFQFSLHWNSDVGRFIGVEQFGLAGLTAGNFGAAQTANGTLVVSWDDPAGVGVTVVNGATLFGVRYALIGANGASSAVTIDGTPVALEATDGQFGIVPILAEAGRLQVRSNSRRVVYYEGARPVPGVTIDRLDSTGTRVARTATGPDGTYSLAAGTEDSCTDVPTKDKEEIPAQGVTTLDITLIRRHILGITPLDSQFQLLAGDVNSSGSVTTLDLTLMRRLILGISDSYPGPMWRFVRAQDRVSAQSSDRSAGDPQGVDFIGIKLGDVNGSWTASP